jgi:hypothetical protein
MIRKSVLFLILIVSLTACLQLRRDTITPTPPPQEQLPTPSPTPTNTPYPYGWTDENAVMSGICFEAANDAAGDVFVLRSAEDHIRFYGLADNSGLCRHPVQRYPFDFSTGRVLAGLWSAGMGCTAHHDILDMIRDDRAKTLLIRLRFVTEGDCPYELIRPFWIGIDGVTDYGIQIEVE